MAKHTIYNPASPEHIFRALHITQAEKKEGMRVAQKAISASKGTIIIKGKKHKLVTIPADAFVAIKKSGTHEKLRKIRRIYKVSKKP